MRREMEKQQQEWQAESDLRMMIDVEKLKRDSDRFKRAMVKRDAMLADLKGIKADQNE